MPYKDKNSSRLYYLANKEKIKTRTSAYKKANREKYRVYAKKHSAKYRDKLRVKLREWIARNREKWNARSRTWRKVNKVKHAAQRHAIHELRKEAVVNMYTNGEATCRMCGHGDIDVLTVDHIANDGAWHRRVLKQERNLGNFYHWLQKHDYPSGFQILCFNCNIKKQADRRRAIRKIA